MFIAMNRFSVNRSHEDDFVTMWRTRGSHLDGTIGFLGFHLLRGPETDQSITYATHTVWRQRADFDNWVNSEQFRKAHQGKKPNPQMFAAPPRLELFDAII